MSRETWRAIAIALGNAMENHRYCSDHGVSEPEPNCPFCSDRSLYLRYRAFAVKNGVTFPDPFLNATAISLSDLRRQIT